MNRLVALDISRFLALLGIMVNHVWLLTDSPLAIALQDYHAVLFVLLSGIVFVYSGETRGVKKTKNVVRAIACIVLGLALGAGNPAIDIILVNYGLIFLLGIWIVPRLNTRVLVYVTASWLVLSPLVSFGIRSATADNAHLGNIGFNTLFSEPWMVVIKPLVYSHYPVLQWFSIFLLGALIGRGLISRDGSDQSKFLLRLGWIGLPVAVLIKGATMLLPLDVWRVEDGNVETSKALNLLDSSAYSGTTLGMMSAIAVALVVICIMTDVSRIPGIKSLGQFGMATMSAYALHVLVYTLTPLEMIKTHQTFFWLANVAMIIAVTLVWNKFARQWGRGPLEAVTEKVAAVEAEKRSGSASMK